MDITSVLRPEGVGFLQAHDKAEAIGEMAQLAHELDIDIWEVVDAAATKPFGFQAFYPGPGVGGHCIPLDPQFLAWRAKEAKASTDEAPDFGRAEARGPLWEAITASALLQGGADIMVMIHPEAVRVTKETIKRLVT